MFAAVEYMLSGLPVVTTPNLGGRDMFLDPDISIVAQPNPREIAQAVSALIERNIPKDVVHEKILSRILVERGRFLQLLDDILEIENADHRFGDNWPFQKDKVMTWLSPDDAIRNMLAGHVDAFKDPWNM